MRRTSGVFAVVAGAARVAMSSGAAVGQEESPSPEASIAPEAMVVEPSTLQIIDVAAQGRPGQDSQREAGRQEVQEGPGQGALARSGATIAGYEPGARGAIEMVLAARAADEAGDDKAPKAFMTLALAAYRAGVPEQDVAGDYDLSIAALVEAEYSERPGLEIMPPEGMSDVCFDRKGKYVACVDQATPYERWGAGGSKLERMNLEEAPCS